MLWLLLAIGTALSEGTKDALSKRGLRKFDEYTVAWALRFFSLLLLIPLLFFIEIPKVDNIFWYALAFTVITNTIASIMYMKALKLSPLSLTTPMLTFTPAFLLVTSPLILGEFPSYMGLFGVILIVIGSYVLNIAEMKKGPLQPFKALTKEKGAMLMLAIAFIWSFTANVDKIAIQHSSPLFYVIIFNVVMSLVFSHIIMIKSNRNVKQIRKDIRYLLPIGMISAIGLIMQMTAISIALVAYVIAIKRTSSIVATIYGRAFFKESHFRERITGILIMIFGVAFISLFP